MTKIIKNGWKTKYIHTCSNCGSVFTYQLSDTFKHEEEKEEIKENPYFPISDMIRHPIIGIQYPNLLSGCVCNAYKPEKKHRDDPKYCLCPVCLHEEEVYLERKKFRKNFSIF